MWLKMTTGAKHLWLLVSMSGISLSAVAPTERNPCPGAKKPPVSGPTSMECFHLPAYHINIQFRRWYTYVSVNLVWCAQVRPMIL
jgi:hypothetical protein